MPKTCFFCSSVKLSFLNPGGSCPLVLVGFVSSPEIVPPTKMAPARKNTAALQYLTDVSSKKRVEKSGWEFTELMGNKIPTVRQYAIGKLFLLLNRQTCGGGH